MRIKNILWSVASSLTLAVQFHASSFAGVLDNDANCKKFGCAVIHDGQNFVIYDVYDSSTKKEVPIGSPLIPRTTGFGGLNLTGSLNKNLVPASGQGLMLGITEDGTTVSQSALDDGNGFLDAGDTFLSAFAISPTTDIMLDGRGGAYSHSFFISSTKTKMSLRGKSSISASTDDFSGTIALEDIGLQMGISRRGTDDGFAFGKKANKGKIKVNKRVTDLGNLAGGYTNLVSFDNAKGIRKKKGDIAEQTIRLDFLYTMPSYDLSMGVGSLNIDMFFELYREK